MPKGINYKKKRREHGEPTIDNTDIMPISQRADKSNNILMQTYGLPTCDFSYCRYNRLRRCYGTKMEYVGCPYRQYAKMGDEDEILAMYDMHTPHKVKDITYVPKRLIWKCPRCKAEHSVTLMKFAEPEYCDRCGQRIEQLKLPKQARKDWIEKRKENEPQLVNIEAGRKKRMENVKNMQRMREAVRDENRSEDMQSVQGEGTS